MDWETMYTNLLITALPGVSFSGDYDFEAEHENDIARVREQAQVDATLERDELKAELSLQSGKAAARQRLLDKGVNPKDIEELEKR